MRSKLLLSAVVAIGFVSTVFAGQDEYLDLYDVAPPKGVMQVKLEPQSDRLTSFGIEIDQPINAVGLVGGSSADSASGIAIYENGEYTFYLKGEDNLWYTDLSGDAVELGIQSGEAF